MIIQCVNCNKKFEVNVSLIPTEGRNLQCGSCNHTWFYLPDKKPFKQEIKHDKTEEIDPNDIQSKKQDQDEVEITKPTKIKKSFTYYFGRFLSYIIVTIISFVALIIVLDTFKTPLDNKFPGLELLLYNLFETIKDIILFTKNLFL